jgi:hypothetical protein
MSTITITEALQEIKTIGLRLNKKRGSIGSYLAREARVRDPLEKDGGSEKFITEELQAINDLEKRIVAIRTAIQRSNLGASLTIGAMSFTVAEWLTWRREIAGNQKQFLHTVVNAIAGFRNEVQKKGGRVVGSAVAINEAIGVNDPPQIVVNIDERKVVKAQEEMEEVTGVLDGKLSLFNATTLIEV